VTRKGALTFPAAPTGMTNTALQSKGAPTNQWVSLLVSGNAPRPEPLLAIELTLLESDFISLRWPSVAGGVYQVQCRDGLLSGEWQAAASGEIVATKTNTAIKAPLSVDARLRFYRVVRLR